jgi:glycosyltransferase involved in cell wall biosynthesis
MPVHNEAELLPYSLPSLYRLDPDEVIILLDRCTDNSKLISARIAKHYNKYDSTRFIEVEGPTPMWRQRVAYLRRLGFNLASNKVILTTDADMILDRNLARYIEKLADPKIALMGFNFYDYPFNLRSFLRRIISIFTPFSGYAGLYAFKKSAWIKTENISSLKKIPSSEDTHLRLAIIKKYGSKITNTKSLHLRPSEGHDKNYLRGIMYHKLVKFPLWRMILYSLATLRPKGLIGYIHSKRISKKI